MGFGTSAGGWSVRSAVVCESLEDRRLLAAGDPFTVVVVPDTQVYVESFPATFPAQTRWIVDNASANRIAFVTHVGDVVDNGATGAERNLLQWQRADAAMDTLDATSLPYSVTIGNHDYDTIDSHASAGRFVEYFGAARYAGRSWYGGSSTNQRNHYQIFSAAGRTFLNLNLQWEPTDADLAWAQGVLRSHPGVPTMITTHAYLKSSTARSTPAATPDGNSGEEIFQVLVRPNPQVFLVVNGHFPGDGHRVVANDAGLPVVEIVVDYQSRANGGDGFLRLLEFNPAADRLDAKSYSPTLDRYETDANSQFSFPLDFDTRFNFSTPPPAGQRTATFRQGVDRYAGARDTMLRQREQDGRGPDTNHARLTALQVDDDSPSGSGADAQALLRFAGVFSAGGGAVPLGSTIHSATLTLNVASAGSGVRLHRMLTPWADRATWNGWRNGIDPDGREAASAPDATAGAGTAAANVPAGPLSLNVTGALRAWAAGQQNWGWALLPWSGGGDGLTFSSSEASTAALRPQLKVTYTPPPGSQGTPLPPTSPVRRPFNPGAVLGEILTGPLGPSDLLRLKRAGVVI